MTENIEIKKEDTGGANRFEMIAGIILAFFTAILAISGLAGGSYSQGIILANTEKANAYDWYNAKGIKQILTENEKEILSFVLTSDKFKATTKTDLKNYLQKLIDLVIRYRAETVSLMPDQGVPDKSMAIENIDLEFGKTIGALEFILKSPDLNADNQAKIDQILSDLDKKITKYQKEKNEILVGSANLDKKDWVQDVDGQMGKVKGAQEWEKETEILDQAGAKTDLADLFLQICLVLGAISLIMQKPSSKWLFLILNILVGLAGAGFLIWGILISWPF